MTAQLALIDEPSLYLTTSGPAYFGVLTLLPGGAKDRHEVLPVEQMPWVLDHLDRSRDSYISQAEFRNRYRTIASVKSIGLVWADLDDHTLFANGDAWAVGHVLQAVDDEGLPPPSLIVHSGRGCHLKWLFNSPVHQQELPRWDVLEHEIVDRLHVALGADYVATDASRVLRICGTVNTKSGNVARIVWRNDVNGELVRYSFDALYDDLVSSQRLDHDNALTAAPSVTTLCRPHQAYNIYSLHWGRYLDLQALCVMRGWTRSAGGIPVGYRDTMLFRMATSVAWYARRENWWRELTAIAHEFAPGYPQREWGPAMSSVYKRLLAVKVGHDERYRFTNKRLISDLGISHTEMLNFKVLIDDDIYRERERERSRRNRLTAGGRPRITPSRAAILKLNFNGLNTPDIASALGVSRRTVERILTP